MNLYIYRDNNKKTQKVAYQPYLPKYCSLSRSHLFLIQEEYDKMDSEVVFECEAETISDADKAFQEATGKSIMKMPFIGVQIFSLIFDKDAPDNLEAVDAVKLDFWDIEILN